MENIFVYTYFGEKFRKNEKRGDGLTLEKTNNGVKIDDLKNQMRHVHKRNKF